MPIYRGTKQVTPHRGGQALSRVYRGDQLVWRAAEPLSPGLVHWARLDSGALLLNSGSQGGYFTQTGTVTAATLGASFANGGSLARAVGPISGGVSTCTWIKSSSGQPAPFGISQMSPDFFAAFFDFGKARAELHVGGGSAQVSEIVTAADAGRWVHIGVSAWLDGARWRLRAYRNGAVAGNAVTGAVGSVNLSAVESAIGGSPVFGDFWTGELDDFRSWNRAVDDSEIAAIYAAGLADHPY